MWRTGGVGEPTAAFALVDGICCGYIVRQEAFVQPVQPRQGNLLLTTPLLRLQIPSPHSRTVGLASLVGRGKPRGFGSDSPLGVLHVVAIFNIIFNIIFSARLAGYPPPVWRGTPLAFLWPAECADHTRLETLFMLPATHERYLHTPRTNTLLPLGLAMLYP